MDLFGVSAIVCLTSSRFSAVLFVGRPLPFCTKHYLFPKTYLRICRLSGQVVDDKWLESPETLVEIPQKLEVSNRTIRRSQVLLHF
jgi:hypothetical protein